MSIENGTRTRLDFRSLKNSGNPNWLPILFKFLNVQNLFKVLRVRLENWFLKT